MGIGFLSMNPKIPHKTRTAPAVTETALINNLKGADTGRRRGAPLYVAEYAIAYK
jgi:hypothetical protein